MNALRQIKDIPYFAHYNDTYNDWNCDYNRLK